MLVTGSGRVFYIVLIFLLIVSSAAHAEEVDRSRTWNIGVGGYLGLSMANQATEGPFGTDLDSKRKSGITVGAGASMEVHAVVIATQKIVLALQPGLLFATKGVNIERGGTKVGAYHLQYVELPILVRAAMPVRPSIAPYLMIGPKISVLISADLENSRGERIDVKEGFETVDLGLIFGAGVSVDVAAARGAFTLEARYDLGLRDVNGTGAGGYVKNRAFFLLLGYLY
jgi:hypothetical protein